MSLSPLAVLLCVLCLLFAEGYRRRVRANHLPFPPGPKQEFLVGNARQLPKARQWLTFADWGKIYGGYFLIRIFGAPFLVINDGKVAFELLDKRSNIYSDRPQSLMANELIGWGFNMTLFPYGDLWRQHRKIMHQALNARAVRQYQTLQQKETGRYLKNLLEKPAAFLSHVQHLAGASIMMLTYGYHVEEGDSYIQLVEDAVDGLTQTQGVGFWVDFLPILRYVPSWVPGAGFQKKAEKWRISAKGVLELPYAAMKDAWIAGTAPPSYCTRLLEEKGGMDIKPEEEQMIKETSAVLYAAGADSTSALLGSFFLACTLNPEIQAKAQAEIDRVVGSERLPDFNDRASLPYVECLLWEIYRWNPAAPLGPAHRLMKEDVYNGHLIPAGSTVIPNIWAMLHDESLYGKDVLEFRPERFEGVGEHGLKAMDPRNFMFGFGRRICIGQYLADAAVYLAIATTLATFDISKACDANGREIEPEVAYPAFVGHPKPFQCTVRPRTAAAAKLV